MTFLPLVIFDCDGVLVDSERLVQDIDIRLIRELGWNITRQEILEQHLGRTEESVMANIAHRTGRPVPETFARRRRSAYEQDFRDHLTEVPGIRQSVQELQAAGHDTCVASSGSHARMALTLGKTELRTLFEGRIYSADEVTHGKPAPDLFLHAAKQMNYRPEDCIVVEDSPSGVAAALSAGMAVIGFSAITPAKLLQNATTIIDDMLDLQEAIATIQPGAGHLKTLPPPDQPKQIFQEGRCAR